MNQPVTTSIPQISMLGPMRVQIFVYGLPDFVNNSKVSVFADVTTFHTADDYKELNLVLHHDLRSISDGLKWIYQTVNVAMTLAMLLGTRRSDS